MAHCESCSMTIESGPYCQHCSNADGTLIGFDECLTRFMQWTRRHEPGLSEDAARQKTLDYMATMPAWKNHPQIAKA